MGTCGSVLRIVGIVVFVGILPNPVIEASEETPPGQGCKCTFLFDTVHPVTMRQKRRSEAQRRHDLSLHASYRDPLAYYKTSLEDLTKTMKQRNERTRRAELDAMHSKNAFAGAQNQVGP